MSTAEVLCPPPQTVSNPPDMSSWNPFGEDNFSKLTEEELIDREFDLLRASKCLFYVIHVQNICRRVYIFYVDALLSRIIHSTKHFITVDLHYS